MSKSDDRHDKLKRKDCEADDKRRAHLRLPMALDAGRARMPA